jgi:hypothetical protein
MYVRMARFEGGRGDEIDAQIDSIQNDLDAVGRGESSRFLPMQAIELIERMEMLVDRQRGAVSMLLYCRDEDGARELDRIMDGIQPQKEGWGRRVSADVYDLALTEEIGARRAA